MLRLRQFFCLIFTRFFSASIFRIFLKSSSSISSITGSSCFVPVNVAAGFFFFFSYTDCCESKKLESTCFLMPSFFILFARSFW